jgi:hypothetical protein
MARKILRAGEELILGEVDGHLEVFDIETSTITHTHKFTEGSYIQDLLVIDDSNYLIAAFDGLFKTTKDQLIKCYYKGKWIRSLCHITDSIYLLGFNPTHWFSNDGLIVWN